MCQISEFVCIFASVCLCKHMFWRSYTSSYLHSNVYLSRSEAEISNLGTVFIYSFSKCLCVLGFFSLGLHMCAQSFSFSLKVCMLVCTWSFLDVASCLSWLTSSMLSVSSCREELSKFALSWIFIAVFRMNTKIKYSFSPHRIYPLNTSDPSSRHFTFSTFTFGMKGRFFAETAFALPAFEVLLSSWSSNWDVCVCQRGVCSRWLCFFVFHPSLMLKTKKQCWGVEFSSCPQFSISNLSGVWLLSLIKHYKIIEF